MKLFLHQNMEMCMLEVSSWIKGGVGIMRRFLMMFMVLVVITFTYDAAGNRITRTTSSEETSSATENEHTPTTEDDMQ